MSLSPNDRDLDRNPANFQPLTPLTFLERSVAVFPDRLAIAHEIVRRSYSEFHARTKKLASALAKRGFARGDTVAVVLANAPAMLESRYGVPMCGAELNTRLDAASIAFMLDHGEANTLIVDHEFSAVIGAALKRAKPGRWSSTTTIPSTTAPEPLGGLDDEALASVFSTAAHSDHPSAEPFGLITQWCSRGPGENESFGYPKLRISAA
jgi:fatty-acyl-CoA synthase